MGRTISSMMGRASMMMKKAAHTVGQGLEHGLDRISDMPLNKSGTIGTEPIGKPQKNGSVKRYIEVKAGRLGKIDIPDPRKGD